MAVNRANPVLSMICRPSKDMFSMLKRNSHLLLYPCMPYATTQTQTTIYVFSLMIPSAVVALIPPTPAMHFISRSTFFFAASSLFPWLFCLNLPHILRCVFCNTSPVSVYVYPEAMNRGGLYGTALLCPLVQPETLVKGCLTPCAPSL